MLSRVLNVLATCLLGLWLFLGWSSWHQLSQLEWTNARREYTLFLRLWDWSIDFMRVQGDMGTTSGWGRQIKSRFLLLVKGDWPWPDEFLSDDITLRFLGFGYVTGTYDTQAEAVSFA